MIKGEERMVEDLDCIIYTEASRDTLVKILHELSFEEDNGCFQKNHNEIIIFKNYDRNPEKRSEFPDGFLYFQLYLEISCDESSQIKIDDQASFISLILKEFWSKNIPAVASCDYEHLLANNGGYKSKEIPWPAPDAS